MPPLIIVIWFMLLVVCYYLDFDIFEYTNKPSDVSLLMHIIDNPLL
jgi:hypothetical protein